MSTRKKSAWTFLTRGILVCFLLVFFLASCAFADGGEAGGDVLTWTFADGVLTISGQGPMTNYEYDNPPPWEARKLEITSVSVQQGVTTIGSYAFNGCTKLASVQLPAGLTEIGNQAFGTCYALKGMTLPNGLTKIGHSAFYDAGITSITIPNTVTEIGNQCFGWSDLQSVVLSTGLTEISGSCSCARR